MGNAGWSGFERFRSLASAAPRFHKGFLHTVLLVLFVTTARAVHSNNVTNEPLQPNPYTLCCSVIGHLLECSEKVCSLLSIASG